METSQNNSPIVNEFIALVNAGAARKLDLETIADNICQIYQTYQIQFVAEQIGATYAGTERFNMRSARVIVEKILAN